MSGFPKNVWLNLYSPGVTGSVEPTSAARVEVLPFEFLHLQDQVQVRSVVKCFVFLNLECVLGFDFVQLSDHQTVPQVLVVAFLILAYQKHTQ